MLRPFSDRSRAPAVLLGCILLIAAALRLYSLGFLYYHPDEHIPERVAQTIIETGTLDTNWSRAGMADYQAPQYNFSAYILSVAGVLKVLDALPIAEPPPIQTTLRAYSAALGVLATFLTFVLARRLFGVGVGLSAASLTCVYPLLYQDSLYARPETFVTVLTLVFVLLLCVPSPGKARVFGAAFVGGLMVATKVSALVLLPWLILANNRQDATGGFFAEALAYVRRSLSCLGERWLPIILGCAAGFAAGVPYALVDPAGYIEGVRFLQSQYSGGHWPHGYAGGTTMERLAYAGAYFTYTGGVAVLTLSVIGAVRASRTRNFFALALFVVALATAVRFSSYAAFFERNVSHVWPIILIFAAVGALGVSSLLPLTNPRLRAAAFAVSVGLAALPAVRTTSTIVTEELMGGHLRRLDALRASVAHRYLAQNLSLAWDAEAFNARRFSPCRPLVVDVAYPSRHPPGNEALERAQGYHRVAYLPSAFPGVPTSSLEIYFLPATLLVYRDVQINACPPGEDLIVSRTHIGEPLPVTGMDADLGWEQGHMPPEIQPPFSPDRSYASWSQADEHLGRMRFEVRTEGESSIVLGYVTGPGAKHQAIEVRDALSQRAIWSKAPLPTSPAWTFVVIPLPAGTQGVVVEGMDQGSAWSEWLGIEPPRKLARELERKSLAPYQTEAKKVDSN